MVNWRQMTVGDRLRVLRKAMGGLTQEAFAREIGVDPDSDAYGHAERTGQIAQMIPRIYRRWPEIDAGWLFHGLLGNIASGTEKRLDDAAKALGFIEGQDRRRG